MFKLQITKLVDVLVEKGISRNEDKEIIVYGLSSGIELVINIIMTIALGFIFGLPIESLVFLVSFSLIRTYAGGYHCKKAINCYFFSSGIVVLVLSIVKVTLEEYILPISVVLLVISVWVLLKFGPVETETKSLDEVEKKYFRKKMVLNLCMECVVVTIVFLFKLYSLGYVVCVGVLASAMLVLFGHKHIIKIKF